MRGWWREITGLVLPAVCGGCGSPRVELCARCAADLAGPPCWVRPAPEPRGLPTVHAVAPYENAVRAMLLAHKERGALGLAQALGGALAASVRAGQGRMDAGVPLLLVPVPSARRATSGRGHDPVRRTAVVAAAALRRSGTPARVAAVLRQRRSVADQAGLGGRERQTNLAGALAVVDGARGLLRGGRIVLVDDLITTGSSLAEAARAVRATMPGEEAEGIRAAVVAASPSAFESNRS
ncbi:phosphoribosyltransferase family protein [Streptomyces sp. NPDC047973]|uniref:ComF family protein n=1 Tax=Streptomyces sp. NPDC047973 TaxID=3155383 RepID=UPI003422E775